MQFRTYRNFNTFLSIDICIPDNIKQQFRTVTLILCLKKLQILNI